MVSLSWDQAQGASQAWVVFRWNLYHEVRRKPLGFGGLPVRVVVVGVGDGAGRIGDGGDGAEPVEQVVGAAGALAQADETAARIAGVGLRGAGGRCAAGDAEDGVDEGVGADAGALELPDAGVGRGERAAAGGLHAGGLAGGVVDELLAGAGAGLLTGGVVGVGDGASGGELVDGVERR